MKIGIDVQSTSGKSTGIGFYTKNLITYLEKTNEVSFVKVKSVKEDLNTLERMKWENIDLFAEVKREGIDLLHIPGFAGPMFNAETKKVTTVHDLIGMVYPENLGFASRFYWQKWLPACVKKSDHIIADSMNTKRDIVRFLGIPEDKIRVILIAVDPRFKPIDDVEELKRVTDKYDLPDHFILNVGTIEPRKNIRGLLEAFARYVDEYNGKMELVLVGKKDWGYKQVEGKLKDLGIDKRVFFTDYVEDKDLAVFYNLAKVFVYPSFYEGFGLPVLEALSSGCSVIASDRSSIPEIVGDAGILVRPDDINGLSGHLSNFDKSDHLAEDLSCKALERAKMFSWEKTAEETLEVYRRVLA